METREAKRRRVYTVEPKKIVESIFARNYLSYLVPALMMIKEESSGKDNSQCDINKNVKHEVDMAMVFSTQGFAWSNGLKVKLQSDDHVNAIISSKSTSENEDEDKLMSLRKLIPGGEKMGDEEIGSELESYIRCLQMQVNVLQCLLQAG